MPGVSAKPPGGPQRSTRPVRQPTFIEEVGGQKRMWVAWALGSATAVYPACCPCCLAPPAGNAFMRVENKSRTMRFDFPACALCARHYVINARISEVMGAAIFVLTVLTLAVGLVVLGGWKGLLEPFRSPIRGAFTALVGLFIMIFWAFAIRYVVIWPIEKLMGLNGPSCRWFALPVQWGTFDKPIRTGLGFENLAYGRRFARENGLSAT